jgi:hypothetical protein
MRRGGDASRRSSLSGKIRWGGNWGRRWQVRPPAAATRAREGEEGKGTHDCASRTWLGEAARVSSGLAKSAPSVPDPTIPRVRKSRQRGTRGRSDRAYREIGRRMLAGTVP